MFAPAIVKAAAERRLRLSLSAGVEERPGTGILGLVDGHRVVLGKASWAAGGEPLPPAAVAVRRRTAIEGTSNVFVAVDGELAGALVLEDPVRGDAPRAIRELRRAGVRRVVMVSGDRPDVAELVGAAVGVDAVLAEQSRRTSTDAGPSSSAG